MMKNGIRRGAQHRILLPIALCLLPLGLLTLSGCSSGQDPAEPGESYLAMLESRDVAELQKEIREAKEAAETESDSEGVKVGEEKTGPEEASDPEETEMTSQEPKAEPLEELLAELKAEVEQGEAKELTPEELGSLKRTLSQTVLVGDSMAQAALEYGVMEESQVFFQRGGITRELGPVTEKAVGMVPEHVIFFTGLNDADHETYDSYPEAYAQRVAQVRAALPDAKIWICSMTPPSNSLGAVREDLARAPVFDQVLEAWCAGSPDATYIDLKWMVRQDWYMNDGIHFKRSFYLIWLQYIAGLIEEADAT